MLVPTRITHTDPDYGIADWSTGTDVEIKKALQLHYAGKIDLTKYWAVGDERTIHLSAMSSVDGLESHVEQDVTYVLANAGGRTLADGETECAFIVCQKNCLANNGTLEGGHISGNPDWDTSKRRTWCDNTYKNAMTQSTLDLFKQFKLVLNESTTLDTYFALPSVKEVTGDDYGSDASYVSQLRYYKNITANQVKYAGDDESTAVSYWTRGCVNNTTFYYYVSTSGLAGTSNDNNNTYGIAPFGCI